MDTSKYFCPYKTPRGTLINHYIFPASIPFSSTRVKPYFLYNSHLGGCQNYGPSLGPLNIRCRIIMGIQKGTIILTTTHFT